MYSRRLSPTTSSDSFRTTQDDDLTESIDDSTMELGDITLLQMKMAEEIGATGGIVPSYEPQENPFATKPPLPPSNVILKPKSTPSNNVLNPKNLEGGKGQETVPKRPTLTDPSGLIERTKSYEKQPLPKECPIEQEAINKEKMRQDEKRYRQLAIAKAQALKAERKRRQSTKPNTHDLELVNSSSEEEDIVVQTIKCDRCNQELHQEDAKCPNCTKPRNEDMVKYDIIPRKPKTKPERPQPSAIVEQNIIEMQKNAQNLMMQNQQIMTDTKQAIQLTIEDFMALIGEKTKELSLWNHQAGVTKADAPTPNQEFSGTKSYDNHNDPEPQRILCSTFKQAIPETISAIKLDGMSGKNRTAQHSHKLDEVNPKRRMVSKSARTDGREGHKPSFAKTPDTFQGEGDNQWKNWEEYLMHYNVVSDWNAWNEVERTDSLLMSLKGDAAALIFGLPDFRQMAFDDLAEILAERFGANAHVTYDRKMLRDRQKEKNESWAHMGQEIHKLAKRVYITSPEIAEREAKDCFIRALPERLRIAIITANPPTLRECIIKVEQMCAMIDMEGRSDLVRIKFAEATSKNNLVPDKEGPEDKPSSVSNGQTTTNWGPGVKPQGSYNQNGQNYPNPQGYPNSPAYNNGPRYPSNQRRYPPTQQKWPRRDIATVQCYGCMEYGHYRRECPKLTNKPRCTFCTGFGHTVDECPSKMKQNSQQGNANEN